jgi:hypothetical protein
MNDLIGTWSVIVDIKYDDPGARELYEMAGEPTPTHGVEVEVTKFKDIGAVCQWLRDFADGLEDTTNG